MFIALQTCTEKKRVRVGPPRLTAHSLCQVEAYITVREVLAEASTVRPELTAEGSRRWPALARA